MKMSKPLFDRLKSDCEAVVKHYGVTLESIKNYSDIWAVFRTVCRHRSYDDRHYIFTDLGHQRILEPTHVFQTHGKKYLDLFYKDEDLNDSHIETALKKIFPNARKIKEI